MAFVRLDNERRRFRWRVLRGQLLATTFISFYEHERTFGFNEGLKVIKENLHAADSPSYRALPDSSRNLWG